MTKLKTIDERQKNILQTIATRMYILTLLALWADMMYRTFALGQSPDDFEDIAIILTVNALAVLAAFFWHKGFQPGKSGVLKILGLYVIMLVLGTIFVILKYGTADTALLLDKIGITAAILAIMALVYGFISHRGQKHAESEITD